MQFVDEIITLFQDGVQNTKFLGYEFQGQKVFWLKMVFL